VTLIEQTFFNVISESFIEQLLRLPLLEASINRAKSSVPGHRPLVDDPKSYDSEVQRLRRPARVNTPPINRYFCSPDAEAFFPRLPKKTKLILSITGLSSAHLRNNNLSEPTV
jgi:hypothetical protein